MSVVVCLVLAAAFVAGFLAIVTDAPLNDDLDSLGDPAAFDHLLPGGVREHVARVERAA